MWTCVRIFSHQREETVTWWFSCADKKWGQSLPLTTWRCVTNSHEEVLKKFGTFTGKQLRLNPFTEHHLTKTLDMYKSITFQIWIVLEIRLGLHCPKKRSFLLRISSVNVSKSADFRVANIYDLIHSYIILKKIRRFPYFYIASLIGILI